MTRTLRHLQHPPNTVRSIQVQAEDSGSDSGSDGSDGSDSDEGHHRRIDLASDGDCAGEATRGADQEPTAPHPTDQPPRGLRPRNPADGADHGRSSFTIRISARWKSAITRSDNGSTRTLSDLVIALLPEQARRHASRDGGEDVKLGRSPGWNPVRAERSKYCIYAFVNEKSVNRLSGRQGLRGNTFDLHAKVPVGVLSLHSVGEYNRLETEVAFDLQIGKFREYWERNRPEEWFKPARGELNQGSRDRRLRSPITIDPTNLSRWIYFQGNHEDIGNIVHLASGSGRPKQLTRSTMRRPLVNSDQDHKYSAGYAGLAKPLSDLLKKDTDCWERQHQEAFDIIKASLLRAPILALPDESKPFSVVCDTSDYAISYALLQYDEDGDERVISFQSRQLKAAERNYPVHDKELLAMKRQCEMALAAAESPAHRFEWADGLLHYRVEPGDPPRGVVPNDENLKFDIIQKAHDAPRKRTGRPARRSSPDLNIQWIFRSKVDI
ncbi:unnamed protein product [Phytophthora fragariaefolia]|uniref:Unnamed protein product n=1 Tax=Phytophthora fragariaefolia TaxID=1490495 RepID=A0A9W6XUT0_9STRA|nr:unnamed protein product [Phytophthora fragariaefolia]